MPIIQPFQGWNFVEEIDYPWWRPADGTYPGLDYVAPSGRKSKEGAARLRPYNQTGQARRVRDAPRRAVASAAA
jgi:hypothetical protein